MKLKREGMKQRQKGDEKKKGWIVVSVKQQWCRRVINSRGTYVEVVQSCFLPSPPRLFVLNVEINFDYSLKDSHFDDLSWEHAALF